MGGFKFHYQYYDLSSLWLISLLKENNTTFVVGKHCLKYVCVCQEDCIDEHVWECVRFFCIVELIASIFKGKYADIFSVVIDW